MQSQPYSSAAVHFYDDNVLPTLHPFSLHRQSRKGGYFMDAHQLEIIKQAVRDRFGAIAKAGATSCGCEQPAGCCGSKKPTPDQVALALGYSAKDMEGLPQGANMGLGCGNPKAIAALKPGETVLDLGSGGGFDCFLAARQVGESGRVIGVDMTPEMLRKARENASRVALPNVEFRLGEIEHLPVADSVVDVILSNCVINLSPDKPQVYREAFRVLKPGGRLAVSDVVAIAPLPPALREDLAMLSACVGGAETIERLEQILGQVGFEQIRVEPLGESRNFIKEWVPGKGIEELIASAHIQAVKPR
jgi:arsenite methyltransferase